MNFEEHLDTLAPVLAKSEMDASAKVFYDVMSAGLVWTDEKLSDLTVEQMGCLRAIFRYRTSLIQGTPDLRFETLWNLLKIKCPQWIGLDPRRCTPSPQLLSEYKRLRGK